MKKAGLNMLVSSVNDLHLKKTFVIYLNEKHHRKEVSRKEDSAKMVDSISLIMLLSHVLRRTFSDLDGENFLAVLTSIT